MNRPSPFSRIGRNLHPSGCASTCSVTSSDLNVTVRTVTSDARVSGAQVLRALLG